MQGILRRNPWVLCLSGVILLTLITIKETALVSWFSIVAATALTYLLLSLEKRPSEWMQSLENTVINTLKGCYTDALFKYLFPAVVCFILGGTVFAVLYSSFGANPHGIYDGLTSWMYWKNTGAQSGHVKSFGYYTDIVLTYDFMLTFLFFTGALVTLYTSRDRYKIFITFWALVVWLIYSIIPYKTPC